MKKTKNELIVELEGSKVMYAMLYKKYIGIVGLFKSFVEIYPNMYLCEFKKYLEENLRDTL